MEFPFELSPFALTAVSAEPAATQALVSTVALPTGPDSGTAVNGLVPATLKLPIIVALLVCLTLTVLLWPTAQADGPTQDHGLLRTQVGAVELPPSIVRVRVLANQQLETIASRLNLPVLEDDSGWNGVLTPQALYWTGSHPPPAAQAPPPPPPLPRPHPSQVRNGPATNMTRPAQLDHA
jgi:hypothetical protein